MKTLDCGIFYEWEYDDDFVSLLSDTFQSRNISHEVFGVDDFKIILEKVRRRTLSLGTLIDRASDVDEDCETIVSLLGRRGAFILNEPSKVRHASDKASMHLEFMTAGLYVPYTIIISPYNDQHEVKLSIDELAHLGRPFIIKPANTTGGGIGVVTGAEGLREVIDTRQHHKDDKYLLQQRIEPGILNGRRAWFRPFYVFGKVYACWWDDQTHVYLEMSREDIDSLCLSEIEHAVKKIHSVCKLDFFSTEIAMTSEGKLIVIDYVNEMCDMRLKSKHYDGVPDSVVELIARQIVSGISRTLGRRG